MALFKRSFFLAFIAVLGLWTAFAAGYLVRTYTHPSEFTILDQAHQILLKQGLKESPDTSSLEYGMIRGMLQAYDDPYTIFVEPVQHELESNRLQGSFGGIGVTIEFNPDQRWVLYPFPDGPAQKAGVQDGDQLLAVEDLHVTETTPLEKIQSAVRGRVGTPVSITISRLPNQEPQVISIVRDEISLPSVTWRSAADQPLVGVIKVNLIAASTAGEVQRAVKDLQLKGAGYFVLDLRDNPGGLLNGGVDIARLFLEKGVVMEQQYRGREIESFEVKEPGPLAKLPLAVLINGGSASAAEIIAGSLQAQQRAPLVGTHSYGKDSVQLVYDLKDGSSLHVTAAKWWIPGLKEPLGGRGLQPDLLVEPDDSDDGNQPGPDIVLQAAIEWLLEKN